MLSVFLLPAANLSCCLACCMQFNGVEPSIYRALNKMQKVPSCVILQANIALVSKAIFFWLILQFVIRFLGIIVKYSQEARTGIIYFSM